jgi:hypothetical protein
MAGRRLGSRRRNGRRRHYRGAPSAGPRRGSHYRNGCRRLRRTTADPMAGRHRCRHRDPGTRRHAGRRHADRHRRRDEKGGRRQSSSPGGVHCNQTSVLRLADSRVQTDDIPPLRGLGRCRSAARRLCLRHQVRHRADRSPAIGQTILGCTHPDRPHRDCHHHGSSRRRHVRRHCRRDWSRHRSRDSSRDACRRRPRPGHATVRRHNLHRKRPDYPRSRHGSPLGPRRTRHGRRPTREDR